MAKGLQGVGDFMVILFFLLLLFLLFIVFHVAQYVLFKNKRAMPLGENDKILSKVFLAIRTMDLLFQFGVCLMLTALYSYYVYSGNSSIPYQREYTEYYEDSSMTYKLTSIDLYLLVFPLTVSLWFENVIGFMIKTIFWYGFDRKKKSYYRSYLTVVSITVLLIFTLYLNSNEIPEAHLEEVFYLVSFLCYAISLFYFVASIKFLRNSNNV